MSTAPSTGQINKTPQEIVAYLHQYIINQDAAKRAVAIAIRNRWRRMQLKDDMRTEVLPKNILMMGTTGVGKTEIARRLADLTDAPFIRVEATKYTEVGYIGRDVESIISDLMEVATQKLWEEATISVNKEATDSAAEKILDALLCSRQITSGNSTALKGLPLDKKGVKLLGTFLAGHQHHTKNLDKECIQGVKDLLREYLIEGLFDEEEIDIEVHTPVISAEIRSAAGMEEITEQLRQMFQNVAPDKKSSKRMTVKDAWSRLKEEELMELLDKEAIRMAAIERVEQHGIVFIDEIDKIIRHTEYSGDVSRDGVQRDLLPLVEGCTVFTKYGPVKTDHILFIAAGAFHYAKPSDLAPELQGRFPIRVTLDALTAKDFVRILTEPKASMIKQYTALMAVEGLTLTFTKGAVEQIAQWAFQINEETENIGARRLHTVMEQLLETIAFDAPDLPLKTVKVDKKYVDSRLKSWASNDDVTRYIL